MQLSHQRSDFVLHLDLLQFVLKEWFEHILNAMVPHRASDSEVFFELLNVCDRLSLLHPRGNLSSLHAVPRSAQGRNRSSFVTIDILPIALNRLFTACLPKVLITELICTAVVITLLDSIILIE